MFKTALLSLVLLVVGGEIYLQVQHRQGVQKVLAAEVEYQTQAQHLLQLQSFWQKVILNSPAYRDGYVQLAYIEEALGNTQQADELWTTVYSLDPNFQPGPPQ